MSDKLPIKGQKEDFRKAVEQGLEPLKESIDVVSAEAFALRETVDQRKFDDLDGKIEKVYEAIRRCEALLDQRMKSFERRLYSGIAKRIQDSRR